MQKLMVTTVAIGALFSVIHCGGQPGSGGEAAPAPLTEVQTDSVNSGRVLATVQGPGGHVFVFGQGASGSLVVAENAKAGEAGLLGSIARSGTIADVYRSVTGRADVPQAIADAVANMPVGEGPAADAPRRRPSRRRSSTTIRPASRAGSSRRSAPRAMPSPATSRTAIRTRTTTSGPSARTSTPTRSTTARTPALACCGSTSGTRTSACGNSTGRVVP